MTKGVSFQQWLLLLVARYILRPQYLSPLTPYLHTLLRASGNVLCFEKDGKSFVELFISQPNGPGLKGATTKRQTTLRDCTVHQWINTAKRCSLIYLIDGIIDYD